MGYFLTHTVYSRTVYRGYAYCRYVVRRRSVVKYLKEEEGNKRGGAGYINLLDLFLA